MADKKAVIVIKKKKHGGHGGAHGGAWKVAYADFVTAMMAFFMVMWLLGSDDEVKAAVAHYFNHPNTPYKGGKDTRSDMAFPLGEKNGSGDSILAGAGGAVPEDLVQRPAREMQELQENRDISRLIKSVTEGEAYGIDVNVEYMRFSLPEEILFQPGTDKLTDSAAQYLGRLSEVFKDYKGHITIDGHTDDEPPKDGKFTNNWELSFAKAVAVMHHFVDKHHIEEEKFRPVGSGSREPITGKDSHIDRQKNRRIEFTLSKSDEKNAK